MTFLQVDDAICSAEKLENTFQQNDETEEQPSKKRVSFVVVSIFI